MKNIMYRDPYEYIYYLELSKIINKGIFLLLLIRNSFIKNQIEIKKPLKLNFIKNYYS